MVSEIYKQINNQLIIIEFSNHSISWIVVTGQISSLIQ